MVEDLLGQEATRSPRPTSFGLLGALLSPFFSSAYEKTGVFFSGGFHASKGRETEQRQKAFYFYLLHVGSLRVRGGMDQVYCTDVGSLACLPYVGRESKIILGIMLSDCPTC